MKVDILGVKYDIRLVSEKHPELQYKKFTASGMTVHRNRVIYLNKDNQCREELNATLLHEIVHVVSDRTGVPLKESQVDVITTAICYLLKKNKKLVKYLQS